MSKEKFGLSSSFEEMTPALIGILGIPDDRRDGLRWSRPDGFVHARASNTEPIVRVVVESSTAAETELRIAAVREGLKAALR